MLFCGARYFSSSRGEHTVVIDERGQTLSDLAIRRVEELPKYGSDRLLLASDMGALARARNPTVQASLASWCPCSSESSPKSARLPGGCGPVGPPTRP